MKPIHFKKSNVIYAENQPEYLPLPAYIDANDLSGTVTSCWKANWIERIIFLFTGKLYLSQLTYRTPLQPQLPEIKSPFRSIK